MNKKISPARVIVIGFASAIILGTIMLSLPFTAKEGVKVSILDALFTSTSAVCVTGLLVVDTADTFNAIGQTIVALLIQIGGLGISSVGVGFILLAGKRVTFRERVLIKESMNLDSMKGIVKIVKAVFIMTICFEAVGAILSFSVFIRDYPPLRALGISLFHSVASFNNAGFDILGGFQNLLPYQDSVILTLTTCGLIIFGGLGFFVIIEVLSKRHFRRLSLHSKIVLVMTGLLLLSGTLLIKLTEEISWLGAFFYSTSARTAGFSTVPLGTFSNAGLFILILLMFIGASPGSTGGGIKTTTTFTLFKSAFSTSTNQHCMAFKRRISNDIVRKAFVITLLSSLLVITDTLILSMIEPNITFIQLLFEAVSAFGTVGLSTGITSELGSISKLIIILTMFTGRLGALTIISSWYRKPAPNVSYSEENITIG